MVRIALCDDDRDFMNSLQTQIEDWFKNNDGFNHKVVLDKYDSSERFSSCLSEKMYDIVFLDVEMPKLNGMELAREIRSKMPWVIILFLTSHSEFAPDGYRVQALRYITKSRLDSQLSEAITAAMENFDKIETGSLIIKNYGSINRVPYRDIVYVHHQLRCSEIITVSQGTLRDNSGIKEIFGAISSERFVFIERGTFINIDYVQKLEESKVVLKNGISLLVSRRNISQVKQAIATVLGG